jgi:hypothetical protein
MDKNMIFKSIELAVTVHTNKEDLMIKEQTSLFDSQIQNTFVILVLCWGDRRLEITA